ncbi:MAG: histone deacetylase [Halobacteriovoraceae bacterium]|nr:histone deacetylase [Halobacteriovoraceae bacterium]|tara:strand:- start:187 stop:1077 length:891 start_codon:yes stop_codon:yes gene_type:complete
MKVFYSDTYEVPLPDGHRFPMGKYKKLRERLIKDRVIDAEFIEADICQIEDLLLAHDHEYIHQVLSLTLERKLARAVGLPLTPEMVIRARASMQSFLNATFTALEEGVSSSLAGGTHHAHKDGGEGFCFFNDFAVATRKIHSIDPYKKILILDLDVHQGNGNSSILNQDKNVFIISFHGETNYPYRKVESHIDIGFSKNTKDDEYLQKLKEVLTEISGHELLLYQAGVDSLVHDRFGSLDLSYEGLLERDRLVFEFVKSQGISMAMALGGGYTDPVDLSVEAYVNTYKTLNDVFFK